MMKKRMMAMLMTAILIIASVPFTAFAEEAPAEVLGGEGIEAAAEAVEAAEAAEEPAAETKAPAEIEKARAEVTETSLDGTTEVPTNWELLRMVINRHYDTYTEDQIKEMAKDLFEYTDSAGTRTITLKQSITAVAGDQMLSVNNGSVVLDLHGCTLDRGCKDSDPDSDRSVIQLSETSLTLRDSVGGGKLTGGNAICGGGIFATNGRFTMEGGQITGNKATMEGGGGIYCSGDTTVLVGGKAVIKDNVCVENGLSKASNIQLNGKLTIGDGTNGAPKPDGMSIGITCKGAPEPGEAVQFTEKAVPGDVEYFTSDNGDLKIAYNTAGHLELQNPGLSITSDHGSYVIGDQIRLTISAPFVEDGTEVIVKEGLKNEYKVKVTNGTAVFLVNAVEPGSFTFEASIQEPARRDAVNVIVTEKPELTLAADKTVYTMENSVTFTLTAKGLPDGTYPLNGALDGKVFTDMYVNLKNETAGMTKKASDFGKGKHELIIVLQNARASVNFEVKEKEDPKPASDDSEPLFTGTWNNPVKNGAWKQDANGIWSYTTTQTFRSTWGYIENPYAGEGQNKADWFYFDQYGHMLTGWQWILWKGELKCFYLNPTKDGTLGACLLGPGKTPDGWEIDETGAWTGK